MSKVSLLGLILLMGLAQGCSYQQNPSFPVTLQQAKTELDVVQAKPRRLDRPVVVVDGFLDPGFGSAIVGGWVGKLTPDAKQVIRVNLLLCPNFEACRKKIIAAVDEAFPTNDPNQTSEVDVVAISMGGIAARYAAVPAPAVAGRHLKIARLFTLSSPHMGAILADVPTFLLIPVQRDIRRGSDFLAKLNSDAEQPDYTIIPYVRLADDTVGIKYAAPPGQTPIWVPSYPFEGAHAGVVMDPRIAADVSRRLRGETPLAMEPRAPLPQ